MSESESDLQVWDLGKGGGSKRSVFGSKFLGFGIGTNCQLQAVYSAIVIFVRISFAI